jgi:hypothetical protein
MSTLAELGNLSEREMSFVFVSHANQDKGHIRHIVDKLIAEGYKVWLDNPAAMNYTADEIRLNFIRLHAGKRWQDEIDAAIREAGVILVCFSQRFSEQRDMWHDEVAAARILDKLVACRIDDVDPQTLRNNFALQHISDVRAERLDLQTALTLLLDDLRRVLVATAQKRFNHRSQRRRDPFVPFLINRTDQEEPIGDAIESVNQNGGVQAFFIAGPENECLDEFIVRLQRNTCAERLGKGRSWHRMFVEWPPGDLRGADFSRTFLRRCARELRLPADADEAAIAHGLAQIGRPVAVLSLIVASEWQADEKKRIVQWLETWQRLARQPQRFSALPMLCLKMPAAKAGWKTFPGGTAPGAIMSNAAIWRAVDALRNKPGWAIARLLAPPHGLAPITAPPLLHPVSGGHAERWLWNEAVSKELDHDLDGAKKLVARLFEDGAAKKHGIALEDFANGMKPLFQDQG